MQPHVLLKCVQCRHFRPREDKLGYCMLFGSIHNARTNESLCGRLARFFYPPSSPEAAVIQIKCPSTLNVQDA